MILKADIGLLSPESLPEFGSAAARGLWLNVVRTTEVTLRCDGQHRFGIWVYGVLLISEGCPARGHSLSEVNMPSPPVQNLSRPEHVENPSNPASYHPSLTLEGWRETCWFVKTEDDGLKGYLFSDDAEQRLGLPKIR